ncbi:MAG TPA: hypothetical protein VFH78_15370 [Candidatus Thermoplasmatota archaeon]|nr:hypothetical protein [Candidatus Thermoplasmatota archaeon]
MRKAPTDEELLALLQDVEEAEDAVDEVEREAAREEPAGDPCPFCGEPAEALATCAVCEEEGCLPRDDWVPGMRDPCLTLCVRCARPIHLACAAEDEAGNPRCPTCRY